VFTLQESRNRTALLVASGVETLRIDAKTAAVCRDFLHVEDGEAIAAEMPFTAVSER